MTQLTNDVLPLAAQLYLLSDNDRNTAILQLHNNNLGTNAPNDKSNLQPLQTWYNDNNFYGYDGTLKRERFLTWLETINEWDTSQVTQMNYVFRIYGNFNSIGSWRIPAEKSRLKWITDNVLQISKFVYFISDINIDVSTGDGYWNVSNCQTFNNIFLKVSGNVTANNWEINTTMDTFVEITNNLSLRLENWNVNASITKLIRAYGVVNSVLSNWAFTTTAIGNIYILRTLGGEGNMNLSTFNLENVTSIEDLINGFYRASSFGIARWDVSDITNITNFLEGCQSFNEDLSSWKLSPNLIVIDGDGNDGTIAGEKYVDIGAAVSTRVPANIRRLKLPLYNPDTGLLNVKLQNGFYRIAYPATSRPVGSKVNIGSKINKANKINSLICKYLI